MEHGTMLIPGDWAVCAFRFNLGMLSVADVRCREVGRCFCSDSSEEKSLDHRRDSMILS